MLGLDVTLRTGATAAVLERMRDLGRLGNELLLPALEQYMSVSEPGGPPVHDVCAVAWVAQPDVFGLVPARVQVETAGQLTAGMTVTDFGVGAAGRPTAAATRGSRCGLTWTGSGRSPSTSTPGWPRRWGTETIRVYAGLAVATEP